MADAEKLLLEAKPHLFAISSDVQPGMRSGDAWMSLAWTFEGLQLHRDIPEIDYVIAKEGGELWCDFYAVPKSAPHLDAAYAFINFMVDPVISAKEVDVHMSAVPDNRAKALLPKEMTEDPIMYPAQELLDTLQLAAAVTLTDPLRAELMARFKAA